MATEVLLMTDIVDLGAEGNVVKVADGYARNYLLPRKLAAPVTEATRRRLAKIQRDREEARRTELTRAREMARRMENVACTLAVKTVENQKLYGSVTAVHIADALKEQGIEIDKQCLILDTPIKELGVFNVKVKLHPEVESAIKVWVVEE